MYFRNSNFYILIKYLTVLYILIKYLTVHLGPYWAIDGRSERLDSINQLVMSALFQIFAKISIWGR